MAAPRARHITLRARTFLRAHNTPNLGSDARWWSHGFDACAALALATPSECLAKVYQRSAGLGANERKRRIVSLGCATRVNVGGPRRAGE